MVALPWELPNFHCDLGQEPDQNTERQWPPEGAMESPSAGFSTQKGFENHMKKLTHPGQNLKRLGYYQVHNLQIRRLRSLSLSQENWVKRKSLYAVGKGQKPKQMRTG